MIRPPVAVIGCIGHVFGCPSCAAEPLRKPWPHVCDTTCAHQAANRSTAAGHARSHEVKRHHCGAVLDDRRGGNFEQVGICGWGTCVQYTCPGCGEFLAGFGPEGCGCEAEPCGHGSFERVVPAAAPARRRMFAVLRRHETFN